MTRFDISALDKPTGAVFSDCRKYRWLLWRRWNFDSANICAFVGLNPSTADEFKPDPTVTRCIHFCKRWGFDGYVMLNAYGFRATNPKVMQAEADPVGSENDRYLRQVGEVCHRVIAGWGANISDQREREVCWLMRRKLFCLGRTKDRHPRHPLYIKADMMPVLFFDPDRMVDQEKLKRILLESCNHDRWACKIRYRAKTGAITERFISPIKLTHKEAVLRALCLCREEARNFSLYRIIDIEQVPAEDVLMPAKIVEVA